MAVGAAIFFEALEGSAGGAEGLILQFDLDEGLIGVEWIMESDGPWLEEGSRLVAEGIEAGPAALNQGRGREGVIFEEIGDSVDGIAFADGAEVDFDAGIGGLDGAVEVVENEMSEASSGHGGFEFEVGWDAFGALHESPGSAQGACGNIVGAAGGGVDGAGQVEEFVKLWFEGDGLIVIGLVEAGDRGIVAIDGHLDFEFVDQVEASFGQGQGSEGVRCHSELKKRAHRLA